MPAYRMQAQFYAEIEPIHSANGTSIGLVLDDSSEVVMMVKS